MANKTTDPPIILQQITAETANAICDRYEGRSELQPLLDDQPTPLQYLDRLLEEKERIPDVLDFMAHALVKRNALWWGCLCVQWRALTNPLTDQQREALASVVRWVLDPSDENRQAATGPAVSAGPDQPAGRLAHALLDQSPDCATQIAGAIHLLALALETDQIYPAYQQLVALGIGVASGSPPGQQ